jgi:hypothetical protein
VRRHKSALLGKMVMMLFCALDVGRVEGAGLSPSPCPMLRALVRQGARLPTAFAIQSITDTPGSGRHTLAMGSLTSLGTWVDHVSSLRDSSLCQKHCLIYHRGRRKARELDCGHPSGSHTALSRL